MSEKLTAHQIQAATLVTGSIELVGSAPCVRGTPAPVLCVEKPNRFSPVCTGNASADPTSSQSSAVQPRVYGERTNPNLLLVKRKTPIDFSTDFLGMFQIVKQHYFRRLVGKMTLTSNHPIPPVNDDFYPR